MHRGGTRINFSNAFSFGAADCIPLSRNFEIGLNQDSDSITHKGHHLTAVPSEKHSHTLHLLMSHMAGPLKTTTTDGNKESSRAGPSVV